MFEGLNEFDLLDAEQEIVRDVLAGDNDWGYDEHDLRVMFNIMDFLKIKLYEKGERHEQMACTGAELGATGAEGVS